MKSCLCAYRSTMCCLLGLALGGSAGCGASSGDVTGTVTFQGKTVRSGTVVIVGRDSLPHYGTIEEDGSYSVTNVPSGLAMMAC